MRILNETVGILINLFIFCLNLHLLIKNLEWTVYDLVDLSPKKLFAT